MGTNELNQSIGKEITLTSDGADLAPFTITSAGRVLTLGPPAVYSTIRAPLLLNQGSISGSNVGVYFLDGGTVANASDISGLISAIFIKSGGFVTNSDSSARIFGEVLITSGAGTVVNLGSIQSHADVFGVALEAGGTVINSGVNSMIFGAATGVFIDGAYGEVTNAGTINGVELSKGGAVTNSDVSAIISSELYGVLVANASGTVVNDGTIRGNIGGGIVLGAGGNVTNDGTVFSEDIGIGLSGATGTVINNGYVYVIKVDGVSIGAGGTITNNGTISSEGLAVYLGGHGAENRLIVGAGAVFIGKVEGSTSASNALELEQGIGTLAGIGTEFTNFTALDFDADSHWVVEGDAAGLSAVSISGFAAGDVIDIASLATNFVESLTLGLTGGLEIPQGGGPRISLNFQGFAAGTKFEAVSDRSGGTEIMLETAPCFCRGTRIATPGGTKAVEFLRMGDRVKTLHGGAQKIKWIGVRRYDGRFIAGNPLALPVRIRRHALGRNVPARDLYVSPDHAICEGGVLIHARRLINGQSISQLAEVDEVHYFHIELEKHDIIFANNCPVESFLNESCRQRFQNAPAYAALYPDAEAGQKPCLPRVDGGYYLLRVQSRINARAGASSRAKWVGALRGFVDECGPARVRGWAQHAGALEVPVELEILTASGRTLNRMLANEYRPDLRAAGLGSGYHGFDFALPPSQVVSLVRRVEDGFPLPFGAALMARANAA